MCIQKMTSYTKLNVLYTRFNYFIYKINEFMHINSNFIYKNSVRAAPYRDFVPLAHAQDGGRVEIHSRIS